MGEVIPVDFRYWVRREEYQKIQERIAERLNYFSQFQTFTEEQIKQSREDSKRLIELQLEAEEWNDEEFLAIWE